MRRVVTITLTCAVMSGAIPSFAQHINHIPLFTLNTGTTPEFPVDILDNAGDVNGDGVNDLVIGMPLQTANGSAQVVSGSNGQILLELTGRTSETLFGRSVSGAGDADGDGFADLIIEGSSGVRVFSGATGSEIQTLPSTGFGASLASLGDTNGDGIPEFAVGNPNGSLTPPSIFAQPEGLVSISLGLIGFTQTIAGDAPGDRFGAAVGNAGDINQDGISDLIVGAPGASNAGRSSGLARVISGSDGVSLYEFNGTGADVLFGTSVAGAGDVNGDGIPDVIVGAPRERETGLGVARVFSGRDGSTLHVLDDDFDNPDPANEDITGGLFGSSVAGAGDVNGDGFDDLIVGAPFDAEGGFQSGSIRVFSGFDGTEIFKSLGAGPAPTFSGGGDVFGESVIGLGDLNGDGLDDFAASARQGGPDGAGFVRVFVSQATSIPEPNPVFAMLAASAFLTSRRRIRPLCSQ